MLSRTVLTLTILAASVLADGIPGLPDCAQPCVTNYGGCNQVDVKCICSNTPLIANLACCVGNLCDAADQTKVIDFADALCKGYGVTNLPTAATCAPGAVSTPFTGTASGSAATSGTTTPTGTADSAVSTPASGVVQAASQTDAAGEYKPQGVGLVMGLVGIMAAL